MCGMYICERLQAEPDCWRFARCGSNRHVAWHWQTRSTATAQSYAAGGVRQTIVELPHEQDIYPQNWPSAYIRNFTSIETTWKHILQFRNKTILND